MPITELMREFPLPLPELVTVPILLSEVVETVMPFAMELLLLRIKSPVPLTPPEIVSNELPLLLLLVNVVPEPFTVNAPLTVSAEVVLFSVMPVTLEPTAALISVEPVPLPELVMVPTLFTAVVESVMPLASELLLLRIKLPVPVTPPDNVSILVPAVLVSVVPLALTTKPPLTVSEDAVLFW